MSNFILGLDIGSFEIKATIAKIDGDSFSICGIGKANTLGIRKGVVTNIEQASLAIKKAIIEAKKSSGTNFDRVIVSISGAYTKYTKSSGVVNIPEDEINIKEIKRAMQIAEDNANIPNDYTKLHVLPFNFKVDDQDHIEDPLGMSGSRLEVFTHIITAQKSSLKNLEKAVLMAGVKIDNIVLSGYASAIAVLTKEEKELGVCVIDMGASTCNIVIHTGNSLVHNDIFPVGSANITNDVSRAIHIPLENSESIKINYSKLRNSGCTSIELPKVGSLERQKVPFEKIEEAIFARIDETFSFLRSKIIDSGYIDKLGAGIVITGGLAKFNELKEIISIAFGNIPIRIAKPREASGLHEISLDPVNTCSIGLCLYGAGEFTPYEIDSNGKIRYKDEILKPEKTNYENEIQEALCEKDNEDNKIILDSLENKPKSPGFFTKISNFFKKIWYKLIQSF